MLEMTPSLPETPDALVLALETASGRERARLLNVGRERFRGTLFNALIGRARLLLGEGNAVQAEALMDMAAQLGRKGVDENAQAKCFFAIGTVWHDAGHAEHAIAPYRRASHLFRWAGVGGGEARVLARLSQALAATGKAREAIGPYRRAIRLAESLGEIRLAAQISNNLGNAYRQAGNFRRARATFIRAIEGARAVGDHELECTARGILGLAEFELGRYPQAEIELRESIACAQTLGSKRLEAGHAGDLGNVYRATGRLTEAEACYRQALALARVIGDQKYEEIGLGDLGILLFQMGRMNEAIALLEEARALGESISALADAARDAYHLSTIYRELGDGTAEEATLYECLRLAEAADEVSLKEGVLRALAYRAMGARDWASAESYLRQADEVASSLADAYNAWTAPFAWGFLAYQQEKYGEAERRWKEAYRLAEDAGNIYGALRALINRGSELNMLRRAAEGESLLREALQRAQAMDLPDDERRIWEAIGLARELQRDHAGAREGYERALEFIESGREALTTETHRMGFFGAREGPYVRLVRLLALTGQAVSAWEVNERARSRGLVDTLARAEMPPPAVIPAPLAQTERELLAVLRLRQSEAAQPDARRKPALLAEIEQALTPSCKHARTTSNVAGSPRFKATYSMSVSRN